MTLAGEKCPVAAGVEGMSTTSEDTISVTVEGDATYEWRGDDAEARHEQWALTGEPTWDIEARA